MRILALGGNGSVGRYTCRIVAGLDGVSELVIADLDGAQATTFANQLGNRARGIGLDVSNATALEAALRGADVVLNTVGPFFRFGVPVLTAAIEAGCHYLDICDDWEPTLDMLALSERARAAEVTALIGMGATPGASNLLALVAAGELGSVHTVITGWNVAATRPAGEAALVHGIREMTGTIRVRRDGRAVDEPPLRREIIDYPGCGQRPALTFGHPEPVTLDRTIDGVTTNLNVVTGFTRLMTVLRWTVDHGVLSLRRAARFAGWLERHQAVPTPAELFAPAGLPPLFALARGTKDGVPATAAAALTAFPGLSMAAVTGAPLAVALRLLLSGAISQHGVFAPEVVMDPRAFFAELRSFCPGPPNPGDLVLVTRSWDANAGSAFRAGMARARADVEQFARRS
ncbi:MAG TPA: saccharopine dehydrogenase NADP-binding domain-containing protein [Amycolatopsis sp.]|uniref:saccharopine dehydrogenase family protein n=1 Tax=Amycolatopsis sp. TaxID=37632 RepID=UPI002B4729EE|nr:saccharopine dehydrogenase NADP-binding domain-containing protein [Amycolatopsis sp.]HKS46933.1 saccharopine dehydrogenase NADP-binding domain-containing protein [Amycolatopsis sp.]